MTTPTTAEAPGRGRPKALTPEVQAKIIQALAGNATYRGACGFAGVHYATFQLYRKLHIEAREAGTTTEFSDFYDAVEEAEAQAQASLATYWTQAARTDWRAARDLLTHRHPEEWAPAQRIDANVKAEHTGSVEHTGTVTTVVTLPDGGNLLAYLGALNSHLGGGGDDPADPGEDPEAD